MKFRVERDALADAVAWTAKSLPSRPSVPVLAGVLLRVSDGMLQVSGFDYEVSSQVTVDVHADADGAALVSGRLLAEITKALPAKPVDVAAVGSHVEITCGSARFTLPTMPVEDYPTLPEMPATAGTVDAATFAAAVAQVAIAAGRDDTLPLLTGVRVELTGNTLALLATDRYRLAVRELEWRPDDPGVNVAALVPARTLADTAKALGPLGGSVTVALARGGVGEGMIGFSGATRRTTSRLLRGRARQRGHGLRLQRRADDDRVQPPVPARRAGGAGRAGGGHVVHRREEAGHRRAGHRGGRGDLRVLVPDHAGPHRRLGGSRAARSRRPRPDGRQHARAAARRRARGRRLQP